MIEHGHGQMRRRMENDDMNPTTFAHVARVSSTGQDALRWSVIVASGTQKLVPRANGRSGNSKGAGIT
jgi:hypothetical protein